MPVACPVPALAAPSPHNCCKMSRYQLLALLFGLLLVSAPFVRADDEYEGDEGEDEEGAPPSSDEKDVVVLTTKNFKDLIKKHKYVLVSAKDPTRCPRQ